MAIASMLTQVRQPSVAQLRDGRVLVAGGIDQSGRVLASAEVYDPKANRWSAAGSLQHARWLHSATLLADGRVLVAGGIDDTSALASAEVYDPKANVWSLAGSMTMARYDHAAILLGTGQVLVIAGFLGEARTHPETPVAPVAAPAAELFDPAASQWRAIEQPELFRSWAVLMRLSSGQVLAAGQQTVVNSSYSALPAELYDPKSSTWHRTANTPNLQVAWLTTLPSGKVLALGAPIGGPVYQSAESLAHDFPPWSAAASYDPRADRWSSIAVSGSAPTAAALVALPGGQVIGLGGLDQSRFREPIASVCEFDPTVGQWFGIGRLSTPRASATAVLLAHNRILVVGGVVESTIPGSVTAPVGVTPVGSSEVFQVPTRLNTQQPCI